MRRVLAPISMVAAFGLVLAGCSGDNGDTDDGGAADTGEGEEESPDEGGGDEFDGVTLEVSGAWSGAEQENFEQVLAQFEDNTGANINYTSFGDKAATTLGTQIEGGSPPDVALISQPALLEQLASDGDLQAISDETKDIVSENYSESWVELATVEDDQYGVWFKASNKSTVWYNADIYDEAGAEVPETWDDFLSQLELISDAGYAGISIGADVGWPITDWFENVYLRTAGADKYDELTDHEIPWTDESVTEALEVLAELFGNDALVQEGADQRTFPESVTEVFGAEPNAGTVYEGDFVAGNIADDGNSTVGENALFYDFPSINGSEPAVVGGGDIAVAFNDEEATDALMQFLASPESAEVWVPNGGLTSPNSGVDTSLYPDDISRQIAESLIEAETFRFDMSDLAPSAFGGTEGQGQWKLMIDFLQNPDDISGIQEELESAAEDAYN